MIGIVVVAHAPLGSAFAAAARHVYGAVPALAVFDVPADVPADAAAARLGQLVSEVDQGDGVLVLADLCGATPANLAASLVQRTHGACLLAGLNLPMLLRAICYRREPLATVAGKALAGATGGIMHIGGETPQNVVADGHAANCDAPRGG